MVKIFVRLSITVLQVNVVFSTIFFFFFEPLPINVLWLDFYTACCFSNMFYRETIDLNQLQKEYNTNENHMLDFAPKLSEIPPFQVVICFIWTFSKEYQLTAEPSHHIQVCSLTICTFYVHPL